MEKSKSLENKIFLELNSSVQAHIQKYAGGNYSPGKAYREALKLKKTAEKNGVYDSLTPVITKLSALRGPNYLADFWGLDVRTTSDGSSYEVISSD